MSDKIMSYTKLTLIGVIIGISGNAFLSPLLSGSFVMSDIVYPLVILILSLVLFVSGILHTLNYEKSEKNDV